MANSVSTTGDASSMASSRRHLSSSGFANAASSKAETKMGEKKGKNAGVFNRLLFKFWGRKEKDVENVDGATLLGTEEDGLRKYSYKELHAATEGFSPERIIGQGGSGVVYKGIFNMINVAVKMIVGGSEHQQRDYISEIKVISSLRHPNLIRLLGYCHEGEHLLLVHEYMPNGGLSSHLYHSELRPLTWEVRHHKIVAGLISALSYLQNGRERCVVHRDIKPSNILLDSDFNPKLTDFELARLADDHDSELDVTNVVAGTMGYLAPEFVSSGQFSKESDIFALGIVILEIACGRKAIDKSQERGRRSLLQWVTDLDHEGLILEAADPRLGDAFNKQEMKQLLTLGLMCSRSQPRLRPSIGDILKTFKNSTLPPRNLLPKEETSSVTPPTDLPWMMPHFLSDAEDYTQIFCIERKAAAKSGGGTSTQANIIVPAISSSTIVKLDSEPSSRASSNSVQTSHPDEQKLEDNLAGQDHPPQDALSLVARDRPQLELEAESSYWDIGIPPDYLSAASSLWKDRHHPVIYGFVASLHKLLQSEDEPLQFNEVLKDIRAYTACLVSVGAPLVEWNSLAQLVLRVSKMTDAFPNLISPRTTTAATISSLRAYIDECTHTIDDHEKGSETVKKQLALERTEYLLLMARIVELKKRIEESEEELGSMIETTAQHRQLHGKLSAILNQYELALSKLSSFTCT